jgi:parallel beta-helix repeat protein
MPLFGASPASAALTAHAEISIVGDAEFTAANGVVSGNGTAGDPYIIEGWQIEIASSAGVSLRDTRAHAVIRNVGIAYSRGGNPVGGGVTLYNSSNVSVEDVSMTFVHIALSAWTFENFSVRRASISGGYFGVELIDGTGASVEDSALSDLRGNAITGTAVGDVVLARNRVNRTSVVAFDFSVMTGPLDISNNTVENTAGVGGRFTNSDFRVFIGGNTIGHSTGTGLVLADLKDVQLVGNRVLDGGWQTSYIGGGISIVRCPGANLASNEVSRNGGGGIFLFDSEGAAVSSNTIRQNEVGGLVLGGGDTLNIIDNRFVADAIQIRATLPSAADNWNFSGNTQNGLPIRLERNCADFESQGESIGQLLLVNCTRVRVSNLNAEGADSPVSLYFASDVLVDRATIRNTSSTGIEVFYGRNITVENSTLEGSASHGVVLYSVDGFTLVRCTINGSGALTLNTASNVTVRSNLLRGGSALSWGGLADAVMLENTIQDAALAAWGTGPNVTLFHNNFLNVTPWNTEDGGQWDGGYPAGGNFWATMDGQTRQDRCRGPLQDDCVGPDGILDTAFRFSFAAIDRYPLASPFVPGDTPPVADFTILPGSGDTLTTFLFDGTPSYDMQDDAAQLEVRFDVDDNGVFDTDWSTAKTASRLYAQAGVYGVRMQLRDRGGHTAEVAKSVTVLEPLDMTPPAVTFASPAENSTSTSATLAVSGTASDGNGTGVVVVDVRVDGGAWSPAEGTASWSANVTLEVGAHVLEVRARDAAGNPSAIALLHVTYTPLPPPPRPPPPPPPDRTAPAWSMASPPSQIRPGENLTVEITPHDASGIGNVTLYYRTSASSPFQSVPMGSQGGGLYVATIRTQEASGAIEYYIIAEDGAGNEARAPAAGSNSVIIQPAASAGPAPPLQAPTSSSPWAPGLVYAAAISAGAFVGALVTYRLQRGRT